MDRTERFYKIDQMIGERKLVTFAELKDALEVSPATLKRDIQYLRDRLNCPLIWDREAGGYRFEDTAAHPAASSNCRACGSTPPKSMPC